MTALNPFSGEFYRGRARQSYTREMFCLMEGRHVILTLPGGVGTVPTIQLFDYLVRLCATANS